MCPMDFMYYSSFLDEYYYATPITKVSDGELSSVHPVYSPLSVGEIQLSDTPLKDNRYLSVHGDVPVSTTKHFGMLYIIHESQACAICFSKINTLLFYLLVYNVFVKIYLFIFFCLLENVVGTVFRPLHVYHEICFCMHMYKNCVFYSTQSQV